MQIINHKLPLLRIIKMIKTQANTGIFDGTEKGSAYLYSCRWYSPVWESVIIFTRDVGGHSSGWWKNPDYEYCYHLSLSFIDRFHNRKPKDIKTTDQLLGYFFGSNKKLLWCEPPYSEYGIKTEAWHYRLFCDQAWQPIKPRGEVYSKQHTPKGWKSYSELQDFH